MYQNSSDDIDNARKNGQEKKERNIFSFSKKEQYDKQWSGSVNKLSQKNFESSQRFIASQC